MKTFATVIVTKGNQSAAQAVTSVDMFRSELKKGFSRYFFSSGYFPTSQYQALVDGGLIHEEELDSTVSTSDTFATLGMSRVSEE